MHVSDGPERLHVFVPIPRLLVEFTQTLRVNNLAARFSESSL